MRERSDDASAIRFCLYANNSRADASFKNGYARDQYLIARPANKLTHSPRQTA
jgi:hypothetical protein